jgi:CRISPR-associated protein Cmr5
MKSESNVQTLDQRRAAHAWEAVQKAGALQEQDRKEFGIEAKKLPARILASGLGQALAFLEAKHQAELLRLALADWIAQRRPPRNGEEPRLVVRLIKGNADFLRFATAESLAYLTWLVRWCEAEGL